MLFAFYGFLSAFELSSTFLKTCWLDSCFSVKLTTLAPSTLEVTATPSAAELLKKLIASELITGRVHAAVRPRPAQNSSTASTPIFSFSALLQTFQGIALRFLEPPPYQREVSQTNHSFRHHLR